MQEKDPRYLTGFGNEHASEAVPGALPIGQNAPQRPSCGLYTEQLSGTPFTAPVSWGGDRVAEVRALDSQLS